MPIPVQNPHRLQKRVNLVVLLGFEPRKAESKSAVLPLHHRTIKPPKTEFWSAKVGLFLNLKNVSDEIIHLPQLPPHSWSSWPKNTRDSCGQYWSRRFLWGTLPHRPAYS